MPNKDYSDLGFEPESAAPATPATDFDAIARKYGLTAVEPEPTPTLHGGGTDKLGLPGPAPLPDVVRPITAGAQIRSEWAKQSGAVEVKPQQ